MSGAIYYLTRQGGLTVISVAMLHALFFACYQLIRIGLAARVVGGTIHGVLLDCVLRPVLPALLIVTAAMIAEGWVQRHLPAALTLFAGLALALPWIAVYARHERLAAWRACKDAVAVLSRRPAAIRMEPT